MAEGWQISGREGTKTLKSGWGVGARGRQAHSYLHKSVNSMESDIRTWVERLELYEYTVCMGSIYLYSVTIIFYYVYIYIQGAPLIA